MDIQEKGTYFPEKYTSTIVWHKWFLEEKKKYENLKEERG